MVGIWSGAKDLGDIGQISWRANATRIGVEAEWLKQWFTNTAYFKLFFGVVTLVSVIGIWAMKKWGTVLYGVLVVFLVLGLVWQLTQLEGELDSYALVYGGSLVVIALGLVNLWRKGELT